MKTTLLRFLIITVIILLVYALCMPELFFNLNSTIINANGDGLKNYYTVLYHAKYGSGFWFKGFAYPFGEVIHFTDGQPALAYPLTLLTQAGVTVNNYILAIFNGSMLLSAVVCAWFLYLIFVHYQVSPNWAVAFAVVLAMLSPQLDRIYGHYGLSYCFVFPSIWYYLIKFKQSNYAIKWCVIICVSIFVYSFLHVYFLAIGSFFLLFYAIVIAITSRKQIKPHLKSIYAISAAGAIPIVLFKLFMTIVNPFTDRVDVPWGFGFFRASFSSLFYSDRSPLSLALPNAIKPNPFHAEGFAYFGFWALFIFVFVLVRWLLIIFKNRKFILAPLTTFNNHNHSTILFAGGLVFLFANAFPFYHYPFNVWADYLPMLKQFRATGRFSWVCYYIFTVVMCLFVYSRFNKWRASGKIVRAWLVMFLFLGVLYFEMLYILSTNWQKAHTKERSSAFFSYMPNQLLADVKKTPLHFQALLSFPFYGMGTEKICSHVNEESLFHAMKWSYDTGLPMLNFNMSRSSQSISSRILQLMSSPLITKEYPSFITDKRPFLLLTTDSLQVNENEQSIVNRATLLYSSPLGFSVYSLSLESVVAQKQKLLQQLDDEFLSAHNLVDTNFTKLIDYNFNMQQFAPYNGEFLSNNQVVFEDNINTKSDSLIEVSFWATANPSFWGMAGLRIQQFDSNNNLVEDIYSLDNTCVDVINNWQLVWLRTKLLHHKNTIKALADGNRYYYTNVMIKPVFDTITTYDKKSKTWYVNNRPFKTIP